MSPFDEKHHKTTVQVLTDIPQTSASVAHRRLIYRLRAAEEVKATALAHILEGCTNTDPCHSAACPICGLAFQVAAVSVVDSFIRIPAREIRSRMTALTIVPASGCLAPDDLSVAACKRVGAEVKAALANLKLPPAIIGVEVSFNEDTTGEVEPHWCVHAHTIGLDWLSDAQKEALREAFPPSHSVKRPVRCDELDQRIQGRLYPFKPERVRRVTKLKTDDPHRKPYRKSKRRGLRSWKP